jgi:hypothetical protein
MPERSNRPSPPRGEGKGEGAGVWSLRVWSFFDIGCLGFGYYCLLLSGKDPIDGLFTELRFEFLVNRRRCILEGLLVR